ncbi:MULTISPECIES: acyl-CoA dehydrogenase family protein [Streptomyces]|uniref:Acyl-CoA dehydrogenase n=1 Tax=Streptomyces venezuelae TaxID=54571 RepID=A0A5P2BIV7_STRVZ|nr:acyl-CoA dehydrogenase family protein [Streptomyces venezuelae]MYY85300.1 acyl-CoA dehydrogenase [Streptomyces sp. SID335]MYZ13109.1 acyl-CoA dehydrogenase [Streptomyces sp. SID337]NDZ87538.1 acyl-CoA/acyl-ACP dehydrogenase [Streptomyces sp. SID10115]NEA03679.1 acyl-CoA/acyl-ACP dehydrogenase [Streptomyces sp. SID10116]NEB46440.1 acyl-CoA/acyl-ACP dehydrogenase [Streptomyces sp. SID339]
MDFTFTEEQQAVVEAAKALFADVEPDGVPSPALTPGAVAEDFDRALWSRLADADLLGVLVAPEHGGVGLDVIALCLVLRESAKVLARVPLLESSAAAFAIRADGSAELKRRLLPSVVRGDLVLTVAANGRTGHDPADLAVTAQRDGDSWVLDGLQTGVPWVQNADLVIVPAHTPEGHTVLALVPRPHDGLTIAEQISTSGERLGELRLAAVRVAASDVIEADGAWDRLRDLLATGTCALALGLGEGVLRMTSEYVSKREQFGHPVATFQAVAVQAADRYIDLRAMEVTLWQAAWRVSTGADGALPATGDVAVAKIWASDGVRRVVQTAQHLHGGFGADTDYSLHRYHAWAKQLELSLGPAAAHEETLGDLLAAHALG